MQNHEKRRFNNTTSVNAMAAIAIGAMLLFSVAGIKAFADNVEDDIQVSPPERTITIPGTNTDGTLKDASTTVKYWVKENSAGGLQGCDASDGSPVTITFQFPRSAVSASPDSLSFSQCGDSSTNTKSVTYTSNKPGDYPISVSAQDSNGRYNTGDATFILHVKPPAQPSDTTNPTISITSPNDGATLTSDSVTVKGTASDSGSGLAKVEVKIDSGSYSAATGTDPWSFDVTNLSEGSHTITAQATDKAGNTATASIKVTYTPPDTAAPILKLSPDLTAEANNADGAVVGYTVTATDDRDPSPTVECTPASGSTFPLGTTPVNCTATDKAGNKAEGSFNVIVVDKTAPVLKLPDADVKAEATSAGGAAVTYTATAQDAIDGSVTPLCTPASGSTFPLGTTPVNCTATDKAGNKAEGSFNVIVVDTTAPTLELPTLEPIEATGPNGAIVTYTATAKDLVDGSFAASCTPASGSEFALGPTTVTCDAKDKAGNAATAGTFVVTVQDKTAPKLTVPADMSIKATGADGTKVTYTATATDAVDTDPTVTCTPASGSTFPVGTTTVSCTATDDSGNTSPAATFKVSVTLTMAGFYQPVDMGSTLNTVKGGSTVPFKFEIFAGSTELTSTTFNGNPIGSFSAKRVACPGGAAEDPIEQVVTATGGTVLRYDSTSGQFVYNWQTPKTPVGACYDTTFTVTADGSTLTAHFKTK